jgi:uncharacterized protein YxeA
MRRTYYFVAIILFLVVAAYFLKTQEMAEGQPLCVKKEQERKRIEQYTQDFSKPIEELKKLGIDPKHYKF